VKLRVLRSGSYWRIYGICTDRGNCHLEDFLCDLQARRYPEHERIQALFDWIVERPLGPRDLSVERCHELGDGLWQFRAGRTRIHWFYDAGRVIVCSGAFLKTSQRTPRDDLRNAKTRRSLYLKAKQAHAIELLDDGEDAEND